jgi:hypothetical protein
MLCLANGANTLPGRLMAGSYDIPVASITVYVLVAQVRVEAAQHPTMCP